jgi:two-component sensor histidine kinase
MAQKPPVVRKRSISLYMTAIEMRGLMVQCDYASLTGRRLILVINFNGSNLNIGAYTFGFTLVIMLVIIIAQAWDTLSTRNEKNKQISLLRSDMEVLENNTVKLLAQNDWLVTEMHHRVKNNLQILSSLINSQLSFITDKIGKDALYNSKHRLYALSLVHQKLVQNAMASTIEMSCCIKELAYYLSDEFDANDHVSFEIDLAPLNVDVSFAIPFELIINELLTNTLKFAFPENQKGKVKIELSSKDGDTFQLVFADNGIGLPDNIDLLSARSLGRSLIMGLSRQIKAQITVKNRKGLEILIDFKVPPAKQNHFAIN